MNLNLAKRCRRIKDFNSVGIFPESPERGEVLFSPVKARLGFSLRQSPFLFGRFRPLDGMLEDPDDFFFMGTGSFTRKQASSNFSFSMRTSDTNDEIGF